MTEKYYNDKGEVAVIYSPDFGAGWYTWNTEYGDELLFDKTLVEMILADKSSEELRAYAEEKWGENIFCGGLGSCEVEFLPVGTAFIIDEYDGNESIELRDEINWRVA